MRILIAPEYASVGGLLLCCLCNLFGGWLYLYDDRRLRLTIRRAFGGILIAVGVAFGLGGYLWSALNGGGY